MKDHFHKQSLEKQQSKSTIKNQTMKEKDPSNRGETLASRRKKQTIYTDPDDQFDDYGSEHEPLSIKFSDRNKNVADSHVKHLESQKIPSLNLNFTGNKDQLISSDVDDDGQEDQQSTEIIAKGQKANKQK